MSDATTVLQSIETAAQGLLFPSESDFPIEPFSYGNDEPTPTALLKQRELAADTNVEETTLGSFFEGLTECPEDASDNERVSADRFRALVTVLETNLERIRVYRLGKADIQAVVLGRHASGTWLGVQTNVVET